MANPSERPPTADSWLRSSEMIRRAPESALMRHSDKTLGPYASHRISSKSLKPPEASLTYRLITLRQGAKESIARDQENLAI